jgi:hypothetical protein
MYYAPICFPNKILRGRTRAGGLRVLPSLLSELSIALHTSHAGLVRLHQLHDEVVPGIAHLHHGVVTDDMWALLPVPPLDLHVVPVLEGPPENGQVFTCYEIVVISPVAGRVSDGSYCSDFVKC